MDSGGLGVGLRQRGGGLWRYDTIGIHVSTGVAGFINPSYGGSFAGFGAERRGEPAGVCRPPPASFELAPAEAVAEGEGAPLASLAAVRAADGGPRSHAGTGFCGGPVLPGGAEPGERACRGELGAGAGNGPATAGPGV